MGMSPELESRLQSAHLQALVPVLAGLGVETIADLEFVQESDFQNQALKRWFCDWRKKTLEEHSKSSATYQAQTKCSPSSSSKSTTCPKLEAHGTASDRDFRKLFGNPSLSADEIKSLYRDLCKTHHPDKGGDAAVFARINEAYIAVVDPLIAYLAGMATPQLQEGCNDQTTEEKKQEGPGAFMFASMSTADTSHCGVRSATTSIGTDSSEGVYTVKSRSMRKGRGLRASLKDPFGFSTLLVF